MLPRLHAERQLAAIEAASVPHMSREGHRDVMRSLRERLRVETKAEPATAEGLAAIGITVERVNADGTPADAGTGQDETEGNS